MLILPYLQLTPQLAVCHITAQSKVDQKLLSDFFLDISDFGDYISHNAQSCCPVLKSALMEGKVFFYFKGWINVA